MYEMKRAGRYGIGFIDPNTINEETWSREYDRPYIHRESLARVLGVTKHPTRHTTSLQFRVSDTVLYYKFCFCLLDVNKCS